jgi:hypothetical protein
MAVYRIQLTNGRFDHVRSKAAALARAVELANAEPGTPLDVLEREWGVRLTRISPTMARSVGMQNACY